MRLSLLSQLTPRRCFLFITMYPDGLKYSHSAMLSQFEFRLVSRFASH